MQTILAQRRAGEPAFAGIAWLCATQIRLTYHCRADDSLQDRLIPHSFSFTISLRLLTVFDYSTSTCAAHVLNAQVILEGNVPAYLSPYVSHRQRRDVCKSQTSTLCISDIS